MREIQIAIKAREQKTPLTIASVEDAGTLKPFRRMDSANIGDVDCAVDEAVTAASFPFSTRALQQGLESTP